MHPWKKEGEAKKLRQQLGPLVAAIVLVSASVVWSLPLSCVVDDI